MNKTPGRRTSSPPSVGRGTAHVTRLAARLQERSRETKVKLRLEKR